MHRVRVPAVPPELRQRRRPVPSFGDRRRYPTAAANTRHPNGGATVAGCSKNVFGRPGGVLATAQRQRFSFRSPPAAPSPSSAVIIVVILGVAVPVAPPAAAGYGQRTAAAATAAADVKDDATTATKGGQGATHPETYERVHGLG